MVVAGCFVAMGASISLCYTLVNHSRPKYHRRPLLDPGPQHRAGAAAEQAAQSERERVGGGVWGAGGLRVVIA